MTETANAETQMPETPAAMVETPSVEDLQAQLTAALAERDSLTSDRDKWKGLSRKHEAAAKAPATDTDRIAALEARAEAAERSALVATIASTKKVPASVLTGTTEDELNASADTFLAAVAAATQAQAPAPAPANDAAASGNRGTPVGGSVKQLSRAEFAALSPAERIAARDAGQIKDLLAGH